MRKHTPFLFLFRVDLFAKMAAIPIKQRSSSSPKQRAPWVTASETYHELNTPRLPRRPRKKKEEEETTNRRRKSESSQHRSKTMASMKEKGLSGKVFDSENASSYHLECRSPFCRCTRWKQDVASRDISLNSINREEIDFNSISFLVKKRILIFNMYLFLSSFFFSVKQFCRKNVSRHLCC